MIEKLFNHMMEEKHDFYHYIELSEECTDPVIRSTIVGIAEDEMHHYKKIYDIIFKEDVSKTCTAMEKAMYHKAKEWYDDMVEEIKEHK